MAEENTKELSTLEEIKFAITKVGAGFKKIQKPLEITAKTGKKSLDIATLGLTTPTARKAALKATRFAGRQTIDAISGLGKSLKGAFKSVVPPLPKAQDLISVLKKGALALLIPALIAFVKSPYFEKLKAIFMDTIVPALKNLYTNILKPLGEKTFTILVDTFKTVKDFFVDTLVPAIKNFYTNVIEPLLPVIKEGFIATWKFIKEKFFDVVLPAIKGLYNNILLPIKDILVDSFVKTWENLKVLFQDLSDGVKKIMDGDILGGIMDIFKGIGKYVLKQLDNLGTTVYNIIATVFGLEETDSVFGSIKGFITDTYNNIKNFIMDTYNNIKNFFVETYDNVISFITDLNLFKFVEKTVGDIFDGVKAIFSGDFSLETFKKLFGSFIDIVYYPINLAVNFVKDIFNFGDPDKPFKLSEFIFGAVEKIINYFGELLDFDFNAIIKKIPGAEKILSFIGFGEKSADELNAEIADLQARIDRSQAGENEFYGDEQAGQAKTAEKIKILQEQLEAQSRARGGPMDAGQPYFVGEQGVELVVPTNNAQVFSTQRTQELLERAM